MALKREDGAADVRSVPRYLFVNENIGGHRTVHANLAAAFAERDDVRVDFLHVPPASGLRRVVSAAVPGLRRWDADLQALRAQLAQSAWVRRRLDEVAGRYDALHLYTQNVALRSVPVMRVVPSVVTTDSTNRLNAERIPGRSPSRFTPRAAALAMRAERPVLEAAASVVANSEFAARSLRDDYGLPASRVHVLPFGISIPPPLPRDRRERPRLVFIGTTLERKGGSALLRVHQGRFADRCDLVLVTPEPVAPARAVSVVDDLVPGDPRLWEILAAADIFVFPSPIDQAPNVVLEAMAAGLPVIACGVAAVPEMVIDGVTGLLVPPDDDEALAAAVTRLLDDRALARDMGRRGRERAVERYDIRRSVDELLAVLDGVRRRRTS